MQPGELYLVCCQGADAAIFALATILLLLARDPVMLPMLSEARRYAPYTAAVGCYLGASSLLQMLPGGSLRPSQQAWWAQLGDVGGLLLAAPQHYLFTQVTWGAPRTVHRSSTALLHLVCMCCRH